MLKIELCWRVNRKLSTLREMGCAQCFQEVVCNHWLERCRLEEDGVEPCDMPEGIAKGENIVGYMPAWPIIIGPPLMPI